MTDNEDRMTAAQLRELDGEQLLDLFFSTIGMPSATVDDDESSTPEETVYLIRVPRCEFDDAMLKYLADPAMPVPRITDYRQ